MQKPIFIRSLKNQAEFDLVNKHGIKLHSPYFILVKAKNFSAIADTLPTTLLFGTKVGRKLGPAVIRNKIKRRIRHIIRLVKELPALEQSKWGLIIIPRKGFEKIEFAVLVQEMKKAVLK